MRGTTQESIIEKVKIDLYPHNRETYERICEMWKTTNKVAAIQATGTGKSYLILKCLFDYPDDNKVVLAPSNYILDQLLSHSEGGLPNTHLMTYAKLSGMSLTEIEAINPSLIVLDEFHRCGADEWGKGVDKLLSAFPDAKVLGTSATPIRYLDNARDMADELFKGGIAVNSNLTDAIVRKILPMPKYVTALYTFNEEAESLQAKIENSSNDAESKKALLKQVEELKNNLDMSKGIPEILKKHISNVGGKYIVFCKDKAHLKEMEPLVIDWFFKAGITKRVDSYRVFHGKMGNSDELDKFRENTNYPNVRLLFSIEMLNEGIHIDDVTGVILLRPTVSPIIHFQQMGRALQASNANEPLIFDFVNNKASIRSGDILREYEKSKSSEIIRREPLKEKDLYVPEFNVIDETQDVLALFEVLESELIDNFDSNFEKLKAYLEEHGGYPKDRTKLSGWVGSIRGAAKGKGAGLLTQERVNKLNSIGFIWDVFHEQWEEKFQRYAEIARTNGRLNRGEDMCTWVYTQRGLFRVGMLSQYRIDKLNSIGFIWDVLHERWESNFQKYADIIMSSNRNNCNGKIGTWVNTQRSLYREGKLSQYHINKLNSIGFIWGPKDGSWQSSYKLLLKYKDEFGDCNVPQEYETEGFKLGIWATNKRSRFKAGKLPQEQINKLNDIGFIWEPLTEKWEVKYLKLRNYKEINGDCLVTADTPLGSWVSDQRSLFKRGVLSHDRIEKLNAIRFVWELRNM